MSAQLRRHTPTHSRTGTGTGSHEDGSAGAGAGEGWVAIQQKTFTKWTNSHLVKKEYPPIEGDLSQAFTDGIKLMELIHVLYNIPIPKYNKNPKLRAQQLDNISLAIHMLEVDAKVKTNFLKTSHLVDHDLKMILGMVWSIILDYAIKGIQIDDDTSGRDGLLLWVQRQTKGYAHVDPPGVHNFTTDWKSGLPFCALIHKFRPDLIDYSSLDPHNAASNIELAFSVAERELKISRLLDVEDLLVDKPDERSIITYVSEYFHIASKQSQNEVAARRVLKFLDFHRTISRFQTTYIEQAHELLQWIEKQITEFQNINYGNTVDEALLINNNFKSFILHIKPQRAASKLDLESLYAEIQTQLRVSNRSAWECPADLTPDVIDKKWNELQTIESDHAKAARENRFKWVTKSDDTSISSEKIDEWKASFQHFDVDHDGVINATELKAALAAIGLETKNEQQTLKDIINATRSNGTDADGTPHINGVTEGLTEEQFIKYLIKQTADTDTEEQIVEAFKTLALNNDSIPADHASSKLLVNPLTEEDVQYLTQVIPKTADGSGLDYKTFVQTNFQ